MPTIYFEGVHKALPKMASGYWPLLLLRAAALPVAAP